jgi:hypothetical protein
MILKGLHLSDSKAFIVVDIEAPISYASYSVESPKRERKAKVESSVLVEGESMVSMEQLSEIIETALFSSQLIGNLPVSIMLIGPSGAGKSKAIMQYKTSDGCHITTDVTSMGLQELMAKDKEEEIRFIIIPDFNLVLSHRAATLQLTIANLLSLTSEGLIRIDDGRETKETKHKSIGIISAMTREMYAATGKKWSALGFNRRFLPINYDYSLITRQRIQQAISIGLVSLLQLPDRKIKNGGGQYSIEISKDKSDQLVDFSNQLAINIGYIPVRSRGNQHTAHGDEAPKPKSYFIGKQMEFTPHIVLRTLARAHALRDDRREVNEDDILFCMKVIQFTRFDQPVML